MGLIYSRAGRVIAWLGAENPHDMQEEGSAHARQKTALSIGFDRSMREQGNAQRLLRRPFWRCVWIIQEIAKASLVFITTSALLLSEGQLLALINFCNQQLQGK